MSWDAKEGFRVRAAKTMREARITDGVATQALEKADAGTPRNEGRIEASLRGEYENQH